MDLGLGAVGAGAARTSACGEFGSCVRCVDCSVL